ncbi:MAG: ABC transporter permease [Brevinematia bacterium]
MFVFLKIALKNIIRSRVRSILTALSIVVGVTALFLMNGYITYSMWGLRESMVRGGIGHFHIYGKGFSTQRDETSYENVVTNYQKIIRELYEFEGIETIAPRLGFQGILSSGDVSSIALGFGGWSESELALNSFGGNLVEGSFLSDDDENGGIIASGLAKKLNAKVGDYLTLMTTTRGGGVNAVDIKVRGIVSFQIEEYNNTFLIIPLSLIQKTVNVPNGVDRIIVLLKNTDDTDKMEKSLRKFCESRGLEYKSWKDIAVYYFQVRDMYESNMRILVLIILGVIVFAIANTVTMNIYDRFREIGTIRAIGAKRRVVILQFLLETGLISIIGVVVGLIFGFLVSLVINISGGIYIPPPPGNAEGYYTMITPNVVEVLGYCGLFVLVALATSVIPAYKAAKMNIVDALRTI